MSNEELDEPAAQPQRSELTPIFDDSDQELENVGDPYIEQPPVTDEKPDWKVGYDADEGATIITKESEIPAGLGDMARRRAELICSSHNQKIIGLIRLLQKTERELWDAKAAPRGELDESPSPYPELPDANHMRNVLYRIGKTIMEHEATNEEINWKLIKQEINSLLYPVKPPVRIL